MKLLSNKGSRKVERPTQTSFLWLIFIGVWYFFISRSREILTGAIAVFAFIGAGTSFCLFVIVLLRLAGLC